MMHDPKVLSVIEKLMDDGISGVSAFAEVYAKPHIPALAAKFMDDLVKAGYEIDPLPSPRKAPQKGFKK
jgi:hypothetical protein